jgi:hypothetical protein
LRALVEIVLSKVTIEKVVCLEGQWHSQHDQNKENVESKSQVDYFVNVALFESVSSLVQNLLGVLPRKDYQHVKLAALTNLATSGDELLKSEIYKGKLLFVLHYFHFGVLEVVEVWVRVVWAVDFNQGCPFNYLMKISLRIHNGHFWL